MTTRKTKVARQTFSLEQAAEALGIGRSTFYRLVKEQRVPHRVLPTGVRVLTQADIDAILEEAHRPAVA